MKTITNNFRHIHDVPRLLLRIKKVEATHLEWSKIHSSLVHSFKVMDCIFSFLDETNREPDDVYYLHSLCENLHMMTLQSVIGMLEESIDFDSDTNNTTGGSVLIKEGYDETLDKHRKIFDNIEVYLVEAAHKVLDVVPLLESLSVEYVPQVGYLGKCYKKHTDEFLRQTMSVLVLVL